MLSSSGPTHCFASCRGDEARATSKRAQSHEMTSARSGSVAVRHRRGRAVEQTQPEAAAVSWAAVKRPLSKQQLGHAGTRSARLETEDRRSNMGQGSGVVKGRRRRAQVRQARPRGEEKSEAVGARKKSKARWPPCCLYVLLVLVMMMVLVLLLVLMVKARGGGPRNQQPRIEAKRTYGYCGRRASSTRTAIPGTAPRSGAGAASCHANKAFPTDTDGRRALAGETGEARQG